MKIRFAKGSDVISILNIYAQYIDTAITFEYTLPTIEEFSMRIKNIMEVYPYLVCEKDGVIIGYAYAHRHMERAAYQWTAELSVYIDKSHTDQGLGKIFYNILIDILRLQGINTVYGGVTSENIKSEKFHIALGFSRLCTYKNTGYKCGKWLDVSWYEKQIAPYEQNPNPLKSIKEIQAKKLNDILLKYR